MALNSKTLKGMILTELEGKDFKTEGEHPMVAKLADAIAKAVVSHITASATVVVSEGSSAGSYKVS